MRGESVSLVEQILRHAVDVVGFPHAPLLSLLSLCLLLREGEKVKSLSPFFSFCCFHSSDLLFSLFFSIYLPI